MAARIELSLEDERELAALVLAFPVVDAAELLSVLADPECGWRRFGNDNKLQLSLSWDVGWRLVNVTKISNQLPQIELKSRSLASRDTTTYAFTPPEDTELAGAATFRWLRLKLSDLSEGRIKMEDLPWAT